jgi:predicted nucleic acid-binding protein
MPYLADTNILLRFISPSDPNHPLICSAIQALLQQGEQICYTSKNLAEFWNVCTRPNTSRGGFGLSIEETNRRAKIIESYFKFLPNNAAVHAKWRQLIVDLSVCGVQVHDTNLVAAMLVHSVTQILTFNTADFKRFPGITVVHPSEIISAPPVKEEN